MTHVHELTVRTRSWPIDGMVSTGCSHTLLKVVAALPEVTAASANFARDAGQRWRLGCDQGAIEVRGG
jgi:hypothetical protein